ncbi:MAG TPA: transcriptional repressor [bacterium]
MDLSVKKSKNSKQKNLILKILRSTHSHPTAQWIFENARKELPNISLGTVYRNLSNLKKEGKIRELIMGADFSRFDGDLRNHDHIQCTACGKVDDVPFIFFPIPMEQVAQATGYQVFRRRLKFFGTCPECDNQTTKI